MKELKFEREDVYKEFPQTEAEFRKNGKKEKLDRIVLTFSCKDTDLPFGGGKVLITDKSSWAGICRNSIHIRMVGYHVGDDWVKFEVPASKDIKAYKI